ncbi:ParA family protein [Acidianus sulfidivorans]|nr:ParA family protein [Acidianus sulfidivorans]
MIIKVISLKGGVGKSVISTYLAKYLSENGKRVLLIDNDNVGLSSKLIQNSKIEGVDIRKDVVSLDSDTIKKYDFIIIDFPSLFFKTQFDKLNTEAITLLVSDLATMDIAIEYSKNLGAKIFVLNMVSPFVDDINGASEKIKDLDFNVKVVIPFIPKVFLTVMRENKIKNDIEPLKNLARILIDKELNDQLISPIE